MCAIVGGNSKTFPWLTLLNLLKVVSLLISDLIHYDGFWVLCTGVFTVSGILDSFIYHGQKAIKKKMEIGKFS